MLKQIKLCVLGSINDYLLLRIKKWGWATGTPLILAPTVTETTRGLPNAEGKVSKPVTVPHLLV